MKQKPKLRYCIKQILGDYYYADTNPDEMINYTFTKIPKELKN